jgi:hypothetical protein
MPQLAEGFGFNLADSLPGYGEGLSHLFQGMLSFLVDAQAHPQNFFLSRG